MAHLHPRDYGPGNLLRLLHKRDWLNFRKDQLYALKLVIDGVLGRYHYLACQKKPPLYYKELEDFVMSTLEGKGGLAKPSDLARFQLAREDYGRGDSGLSRGKGGSYTRGTGGRRGAPSATVGSGSASSGSASNTATLSLCHQFNSPAGCPRESSGRKCILGGGRVLYHLCNKTDGKGEECLATHARPAHK